MQRFVKASSLVVIETKPMTLGYKSLAFTWIEITDKRWSDSNLTSHSGKLKNG